VSRAPLTLAFDTELVWEGGAGVLAGAFQSEREEETRDRAERGSAVRGSDQASVAAKRTPLADPNSDLSETHCPKPDADGYRVAAWMMLDVKYLPALLIVYWMIAFVAASFARLTMFPAASVAVLITGSCVMLPTTFSAAA
jgi:hypothetical protein